MKLRAVGELRKYLQSTELSPERFSVLCGISNMTIRRWLKLEDKAPIPKKYWPMFDNVFINQSVGDVSPSFKFEDGFAGLEDHVFVMGKTAPDTETLQKEYQQKSQDKMIGIGLLDKVKQLFHLLTSDQVTTYQRTLVLGAIIYFISPIDLIPDATPVVGYLDDYAVVTMVLASIGTALRKNQDLKAQTSS